MIYSLTGSPSSTCLERAYSNESCASLPRAQHFNVAQITRPRIVALTWVFHRVGYPQDNVAIANKCYN
jgi:hypothetical protein